MAGVVPALAGVGRGGEDFADQVEGFDVSRRIRARGAADGRLIYQNNFAQPLGIFHAAAGDLVGLLRQILPKAFGRGLAETLLQRLIDHIVNQSGFAGAGDARDRDHHVQRDRYVDAFEIVRARAVEFQKVLGIHRTTNGGAIRSHVAAQIA